MTRNNFSRILIIQTAFIGDVILATSLIEKLHEYYPESSIDFLLRKGNETLLANNPHLNKVLIWDKKKNKLRNLLKLAKEVRSQKYDLIVNCHRFASSGLITYLSNARVTAGFTKNPFSFSYDIKVDHVIDPTKNVHEIERNQLLITSLTDDEAVNPKLYPTESAYEKVSQWKNVDYVCMAPSSVWATKQLPEEKWVELISSQDKNHRIYLIGGPSDYDLCESIVEKSENKNVFNLAGKFSLIESAALISGASRVYVNDSAPLHMASALNVPTTAFFCSTIPEFGFGPLADNSNVIQVEEGTLACRPCGLHGKKKCPEGHFLCGYSIHIR